MTSTTDKTLILSVGPMGAGKSTAINIAIQKEFDKFSDLDLSIDDFKDRHVKTIQIDEIVEKDPNYKVNMTPLLESITPENIQDLKHFLKEGCWKIKTNSIVWNNFMDKCMDHYFDARKRAEKNIIYENFFTDENTLIVVHETTGSNGYDKIFDFLEYAHEHGYSNKKFIYNITKFSILQKRIIQRFLDAYNEWEKNKESTTPRMPVFRCETGRNFCLSVKTGIENFKNNLDLLKNKGVTVQVYDTTNEKIEQISTHNDLLRKFGPTENEEYKICKTSGSVSGGYKKTRKRRNHRLKKNKKSTKKRFLRSLRKRKRHRI